MPPRFASHVVQRAVYKVSYSSKFAKHARKMRETRKVGGCNIATAYFKKKSTGQDMYVTKASASRHSEKRIYDILERDHSGDYKVHWLYTELEPCGPEVHNCKARVATWFPGANVYYSFIYPDAEEVSSDEESDTVKLLEAKKRRALKWAKKQEKAKRRRKRSVNLLKRLNNQQQLKGLAESDF